MRDKILIGIAPGSHSILANDELELLSNNGYKCISIQYGNNDQSISRLNKLIAVFINTWQIIFKLYEHKVNILYLNSRLEPVASLRDFITIILLKWFYWYKIKIIIKTHGSDLNVLHTSSLFYKYILLPYLWKNVDAWIFLSSDERNSVLKYKKNLEKKVYVIPNIIDSSRCSYYGGIYERYRLNEDKFHVLFSGRMVQEKGCYDVLRSIPFLKQKDNFIFIFLGNGEELSNLKLLSVQLNIEQNVKFLGYIPEEESDHIYSIVDLFVLPTYFNEGFPMALFKAVAAGVPIITTRIRAAKDYLEEPRNVLWVAERSPIEITNAIEKLYNSKSLQNAMKINNYALATRFNRDAVSIKLANVFSSV